MKREKDALNYYIDVGFDSNLLLHIRISLCQLKCWLTKTIMLFLFMW